MRHPNNTSLAIAQPAEPNIVVLPDHEPEPPPTSPAAAPPSAIGNPQSAISKALAGIGRKPAATGTKQKTYPEAPASPDLVKLVDFLVEHMPFVDAVENGKKELARLVTPFYFGHATGRAEVESSVITKGTKAELMVVFPKQLVGAFTEADLSPVLGQRTTEFFRAKWALDIDGDKIPANAAQSIINELQALFARHHCADALSASEKFVPLEEFHLRRHCVLTPDQNLALNSVARIKTSIKIRK